MSTRILFLYARLNGFVLSTAKALARHREVASVDIVYWDQAADIGNRYVPEPGGALNLHRRSRLDARGLDSLLDELRPQIVYVSGWMDRLYLRRLVAYRRRVESVTSVCGFDDQWLGTPKQVVASMMLGTIIPKIFDIAWVSGAPQYYYARRLGFQHQKIVYNLLSADTETCSVAETLEHRFLFVGRLDPVKGLVTLVEAHRVLSAGDRHAWPLTLIGDGPLRDELVRRAGPNVEFVPYLQPRELAAQLARGGVGVLPSVFESWGVSLHEMALSGLPLIASGRVGSASEFLIDGHNGRIVRPGDVADLRGAMSQLAALSDGERSQMGRASRRLGERISPNIAAASILAARRHAQL